MLFNSLKSMLLMTTLLATSIGTITNQVIKLQQPKAVTDTISTIAKKYESATVDISTINYQNFYQDISNSNINTVLAKVINPSFEIYKTNAYNCCTIYYKGEHGNAMKNLYSTQIKNDSIKIMSVFAILTLISDIAHYYGDSTTIDIRIKMAAITKDISVINEFVNNVEKGSLPLASGPNFLPKINQWKDNIFQIINDALTKNYANDELLSKYNNINFNNLATYHGNLHYCDDDMLHTYTTESVEWLEHIVDDWFNIGTPEKNNLFTITLVNDYQFKNYQVLFFNNYRYYYSVPSSYDLQF